MNFLRISRNLLREFFPAVLVWIVGDLYVTASHLTWPYRRFTVDLVLLLAVIVARFTAPASRTREQLRWFFTPEVGGVCLFIALGHFATWQSWSGAWLIAIELSFWFCLARVCKLSWQTTGRIRGFALVFFYAVHRLVETFVKTGIDWSELMGDVLGVALFTVTLAVIMLWFAGRDDRPHLIKLGL